ncbi:MAG: hypothetical protein H0V17_21500 [Deltaproteobacteria bacterium]|nr:hypothetical protein [Deltaproteobacteria bacterium]
MELQRSRMTACSVRATGEQLGGTFST